MAGVDDFAIRRGQHYGTLIIDIETGAPLDLIEGRDAQPPADWLAAHPGVEVICRDRSGSYANPRELHLTGEKPQVSRSQQCRNSVPRLWAAAA